MMVKGSSMVRVGTNDLMPALIVALCFMQSSWVRSRPHAYAKQASMRNTVISHGVSKPIKNALYAKVRLPMRGK